MSRPINANDITFAGGELAIAAGSVGQLLQGDKNWINKLDLPIQTLVQAELDAIQAQIDALETSTPTGVTICTGVGDGVTDDYAAMVVMFALTPDGGTAQLVRGRSYLCKSNITVNCDTRSIHLDGNYATVLFDNPYNRMLFQTAFQNVQTMSSMGTNGFSVVVSNAAAFRTRDFLRLYSNDSTTGAKSASFYRAEDLFVESADTGSNTLYFREGSLSKVGGGLVPAYTTSPKVAQRSGKTLRITNVTVNHTAAAGALFVAFSLKAMVEIEGFTNAYLDNVSSTKAFLPGIIPRACVNTIIIGGQDGNHDDTNIASDVQTFGYGITDCSTGTRIIARSTYRCRHAIDTSEQAGLGSSPQYYGTSVGLRAIGCRAEACTEDSYSTHHSCRDAMFINCTSMNSGNPSEANNGTGNNTGYAFGIRGEATLISCSDYNCYGGWHVFDELTRTPAYNRATIINYRSYASGPCRNQNHVTPVNVYNMITEDTASYNPAFFVQNFDDGITRFHGTTKVRIMTLTGSNAFIGPNTKGIIEFDKFILDMSGVTNVASSYIFDVQGNGASAKTVKIRGDTMYILGAGASAVFKRNTSNYPDADQLRFKLCCEDGVLTYTGGLRNDQTNMQLDGSNDRACHGNVTIINAMDRFKGGNRVEDVTVSFGTIGDYPAIDTATVALPGFKSGDDIQFAGSCLNANLEFVKLAISADDVGTVTVRNLTTSATYDTQSIKLVVSR